MQPTHPSESPVVSWSPPDTVVDAPRRGPLGAEHVAAAPSSRALVGSPVDRLQPRTVGQLLDGGFEVLRFRARTIAIVAATIILPLYALPQLLITLLGGESAATDVFSDGGTPFLAGTGSMVSSYGNAAYFGYLVALGLAVAQMLTGVAVAHLVTAWMVGSDPGPSQTLRFVLRRSPVALAAFTVALLFKAAAGLVTCGLALLFIIPLLSVLAPVVAVEPIGSGGAVSRTLKLANRRVGPLMMVSLLWLVVSLIVTLGTLLVTTILESLLGQDASSTAIIIGAVTVGVSAVLMVVQVAVTVLVYVDLRVRTEGLDLELEATDALR